MDFIYKWLCRLGIHTVEEWDEIYENELGELWVGHCRVCDERVEKFK